MTPTAFAHTEVTSAIDQVPTEYIPALIKLIDAFREGVTTLPSAESSFEEGWRDIQAGNIHPIETLWEGIEDVD